ncbi:hypothetical protein BH11CYA1_BH11CYA1_12100 [soil metagenome]
MVHNDGLLLGIGSAFLFLVGCGIVTGCSTTKNNTSFEQSPVIWSIGIGMQSSIALVCLAQLDSVAPSLQWASQPLTKLFDSNHNLLFVAFIIASACCGAVGYLLRKLVIYLGTTNSSLAPQKQSSSAIAPNVVAVEGSSDDENQAYVSSNLTRVTYTRSDFRVYGTLALLMAGLAAMMTYSTLYSFPWQADWATTPGVVTDVQSMGKTQRVDYTYPVAKQEIARFERFHWHGMLLHKGDAVVVRYDPSFPFRSKIQTGPTIATVGWGLSVIFTMVSAVSIFQSQPGETTVVKWKAY